MKYTSSGGGHTLSAGQPTVSVNSLAPPFGSGPTYGPTSNSSMVEPQSMSASVPAPPSRGVLRSVKTQQFRGAMSSGQEQQTTPAPDIKQSKVLEVGRGARIAQEIGVDEHEISFWKPEPSGLIYVNYVSQAECDRILAAGKRGDKEDGAFAGVKLAN
jgi:hypothetical protein